MTTNEIVSQLTLEEKAALCSGRDFWNLKGVERLGLPAVMVTDGPHGLRKQAETANRSVPATCFPAACATACSFDRALLTEIGAALGEECRANDVAVILGPGANIKRGPLCGRNFEYFSEDPCLSGECAAALIRGVQSRGVGTSLKHFAVNNQEKRRMTVNAVVDERALREIYLAGFERAVREAAPWTVMCSYNRVNGTYASEHRRLLTEILRADWGFTGLVMTDWGAASDRVAGIKAGLDLQMPGPAPANDRKIIDAVRSGALPEADLDRAVTRIVDLIQAAVKGRGTPYTCDLDAHHALARRAAAASAVLLKNDDDVLPLTAWKSVALIGAFAEQPRYQGAGSSRINPTRVDEPWDAFEAERVAFDSARGYRLAGLWPEDLEGEPTEEELLAEAVALAEERDVAVVFAGLPDEYESEGFDRTSLDLPESHNRLIEAVARANPRTVVVLQTGAPVRLPWADRVKGILLLYLGGQAGAGAAVDLLMGNLNPSGKLAETWPLALEDTPCARYFPGGLKNVEYRESVFVGYRYYDAADRAVRYPFGHGLTYTRFEYTGISLSAPRIAPRVADGDGLRVTFTVRNAGYRDGAEVAQVYVAPPVSSVLPRPPKELRGFVKIPLAAGESRTVTVDLDARAFAYYHVPDQVWAVEGGAYTILVGASSRDIRLEAEVEVTGDGREAALAGLRKRAPAYFDLQDAPFDVDDGSFEAVYGAPLPVEASGPPYTVDTSLEEIQDLPLGKTLLAQAVEGMSKAFGGSSPDLQRMAQAMVREMPLRGLGMGGGMTPEMIDGVVRTLNGE